jgi:Protein of unknown function (DUF1236)
MSRPARAWLEELTRGRHASGAARDNARRAPASISELSRLRNVFRNGSKKEIEDMRKTLIVASALLAALPFAAQAQNPDGAAAGAAAGAAGGAVVGGPIGAAVGGVTGAIVGGLSPDFQPRFRTYVVEQQTPSYAVREDIRVGTVLPARGVRYYEVPAEYGVRGYRYTVVNNRAVLVDPGTHRIVQVID